MRARELSVWLDGRRAGNLAQTASGNLLFEYDDDYQASDDATPLSLSMPLVATTHRKRVVLPWLQGLLPDSDEVLRAIGRRFGVSAANPFALLEHVGADAAGAVQILQVNATASDAGTQGDVRRVSDADVADLMRGVVAEYRDGAGVPVGVGRFSLAGAQPKIALHLLPDGAWGVPQDATPTTHILKPVVGVLSRMDVVEQLTMNAARTLGNEVAQTSLMSIGGWDVLVSERFDRRYDGQRWRRLHQEDLCQALSVPPSKKYQQGDGGPGAAAVAGLLRALPVPVDRSLAGDAFFRALVFNVVAGCTDAHAKNYALLLDRRSVRLAPLYDLITYAGYWDGRVPIRGAMSIGGEYALDRISVQELVRTGSMFGVSGETAGAIVQHVRMGLLDAFADAHRTLVELRPDAAPTADDVMRGLAALPLLSR